MSQEHRSGFVNLIGNPNVGKSSLLNALIGTRLAVVNPKAQTTRQRLFGILNEPGFQIVFSDLPGVIKPAYRMQERMMGYVREAIDDADVFLFMAELGQREFKDPELLQRLSGKPVVVVINKIDLGSQAQLDDDLKHWATVFPVAHRIIPLSVTEAFNVGEVLQVIKALMPEGPQWFPADQLTDRSERYVVAEIIRGKILSNYHKEIPYSVQVEVTEFVEEETIIRMRALILCARDSQKNILIGAGGKAIKKVGTEARRDAELFFGKQIFLETFVKVDKDWRDDERKLRKYGY